MSTSAEHHAVDRSLSRFDLARPADYACFLRVQLAALTELSVAWGRSDRADLDALIDCLRVDLVDTEPARPAPDRATVTRTPFTEAGVAYVIRGSRLGAAILLKRVGPKSPIRYLTHRLAVSWPAFIARLSELDAIAERESIDDCVAAARSAFAAFARAARVPSQLAASA